MSPGTPGLDAVRASNNTPAPGRRRGVDMQPVADLEHFDVAQIGVQPCQRLVLRRAAHNPAFGEQAQRVGAFENDVPQRPGPAPVETVGGGIFVDQPLELRGGSVVRGMAQRRCQVADRDPPPSGAARRRLRQDC